MKTIFKQIVATLDAAIAASLNGNAVEAIDRLDKLNDLVNSLPDDNLQAIEEQKTVEQHGKKTILPYNANDWNSCSCTCDFSCDGGNVDNSPQK